MATGSRLSFGSGHEPFYDFPCSICEEEGKQVEAVRYCGECFVYMCDSCIINHNKFPLHRRHKLLDQSQFVKVAQSRLVSFPTTRCLTHPGELVNIYCGNHDIVCCSSCKALEHSNCAKTKHLIDAAKGIQKSNEYQTIKQETRNLLDDAARVLADRKADISRIENERQRVKDVFADFRKTVNKYFDVLEEKALDVLHDESELILSSCEQDTQDIAVLQSTADDMLKQLESFKGDNECDLFVQIKTDKEFLSNAIQEVNHISKTIQKDTIHFLIDPKIEKYISSLEELGSFTDIPQAQLYGKYYVKEKSDFEVCDLSGICQLPDGTIIVLESNNKELKRLDQSYKLLDSLKLHFGPTGICTVGSMIAVCTFYDIKYISVGKGLRSMRSFSTDNENRGISYIDDKLYICGTDPYSLSDVIEVYNKADQQQNSISGLSFVPWYITVTDDCQHLLVTDMKSDDITMMDLTGNVVNKFSNRNLKRPRDICTDGKGHAFICGIDSNTVVQLEPKQQRINVILGEKDGIKEPIAICFDRKQSRLLVSCRNSSKLLVFRLK